MTFETIGVGAELRKGIEDLGFVDPMPIQEKIIPLLLEGREDLIGLAQTGTGKTAAFGLPLLQRIDPQNILPQVLVLAPTRELCLQIAGDFKNFAKYVPEIGILAIYGGADMERQIQALKKRAQVIVATPGRMNDLLNRRKKINLSKLQTVVLDEADEMLNMGFKEELDAILSETPPTKQTLLFSATMPREVMEISKNYMQSPREITVGPRDAGAEQVTHICYIVKEKDRYLALKRVVDYHPDIYGIIFCRTRLETTDVANRLIQDGYNADALHGDLSQGQREHIMHKFRVRNLQILVATDVAARGLDVKDVSHIINYNLPEDTDTYIHRSGRTGRAWKKGMSIAIINLKEKYKIKGIEVRLRKKFTVEPVPDGRIICEKQVLNLVDKLEKIEVDHKAISTFLPAVYEKLEWLSREEMIKHFVSLEFNRFLEYYKDSEDLIAPQEKQTRKIGGKPVRPVRMNSQKGEYTRFFINLGFKDSLTPMDMIGLIKRCTRNRNIDIGRIELMKRFSFFEVDQNYAVEVLSGFAGIEYNSKPVVVEMTQKDETPAAEKKTFQKKIRK